MNQRHIKVKSILCCAMVATWFGCQNRFAVAPVPPSPQPVKTNSPKLPSPITPADLDNLKRYAESYEPKSTKDQIIPSPPFIDEPVLRALKGLSDSQSREHEKYIVLIFLRIYRFHIEHFSQGYDLSEPPGNPLTQEFFRLIGHQKAEMDHSALAVDWVEENPELLEYPLIKSELVRIVKARKRVEAALEKTRGN